MSGPPQYGLTGYIYLVKLQMRRVKIFIYGVVGLGMVAGMWAWRRSALVAHRGDAEVPFLQTAEE